MSSQDKPDRPDALPVHLEARDHDGARQVSPTANRNKYAISEVMLSHLSENAHVLEIASGSGEHGLHMCAQRTDIIWQPSDPDASARASQAARHADMSEQMRPPLDIDVMQAQWWDGLSGFNALYCSNMIHIAPWEATVGLARGAAHILAPQNKLFLYGPFLEGADTAPSNLDFDMALKARNPAWGVRNLSDVKHIFADFGLNRVTRFEMPKNNRLLVFEKTA